MSETIEDRLARVEAELADLKRRVDAGGAATGPKDPYAWRSTVGMSANDPGFEEMVRLGREYRKAQRWEDEPDAGAGH